MMCMRDILGPWAYEMTSGLSMNRPRFYYSTVNTSSLISNQQPTGPIVVALRVLYYSWLDGCSVPHKSLVSACRVRFNIEL
jgi:hypothetical protein